MALFRNKSAEPKEPELSGTAIQLAQLAEQRLNELSINGGNVSQGIDAILVELDTAGRKDLIARHFASLSAQEQLAILAEKYDDSEIRNALAKYRDIATMQAASEAQHARVVHEAKTRRRVNLGDIALDSYVQFNLHSGIGYDNAGHNLESLISNEDSYHKPNIFLGFIKEEPSKWRLTEHNHRPETRQLIDQLDMHTTYDIGSGSHSDASPYAYFGSSLSVQQTEADSWQPLVFGRINGDNLTPKSVIGSIVINGAVVHPFL